MSIFDDLENTEDFIEFKGEKIPMFAPDLIESTTALRQIGGEREPLPESATEAEKRDDNTRYSVELAKKAVELTVPRLQQLKDPSKAAARLIMKTGGLMGELTIKAVGLCGWNMFFVYTVGSEEEQEARDKEDE